MRTVIGVNDPQAVKKWSLMLAASINKSSYFTRKFMKSGKDARVPIQMITDLESDAGDAITVDLLMPMTMEPIISSDTLDGKEQPLKYYTDKLTIDQVRGGVDLGDRMTRKRTLRDIRGDAKRAMSDWWKRLFDELFFIYLSGVSPQAATSAGFVWSANNPFFSVNPITAPDSMHMLYGNNATAKTDVGNDDGYDLRLIDRAVAKAETMGGDSTGEISMLPVEIEGEEGVYVNLMHTFQFDALKSNTQIGQWLDIQKAAAASQGQSNPIFSGAEGRYNNTIIHKHRNVLRFSDYGVDAKQPAARALFMGAQAAFIGFGSPGSGLRFDWTEEVKDHGNSVRIGSNSIFGVKKATYKSKDNSVVRDFGVFAIDTYCKDPNA
ncbi:MAG: N4-gp56 family major capsid protein [Chryseolinea sp.]